MYLLSDLKIVREICLLNLMTFIFIIGVLAMPSFTSANLDIRDHVVGGADADILEVPWQVYVQISKTEGTFACGGTLVAERWVLTAAHCFNNSTSAGEYVPVAAADITVFSGSGDLSRLSQLRANSVSRLIVHGSYRQDTNSNDISLLELHLPVPTPAQPIRLMDFSTQQDADLEFESGRFDNLFLSGWGRTSTDGTTSTQVLQKATLDGVDDQICAQSWGWPNSLVLASTFICANATNKGSCSGDSGGPLVWQDKQSVGDADKGYRLAGVVSFGNAKQCAYNPLPDVYTQVSNYNNWIKDNIVAYQAPNPSFSFDIFSSDNNNITTGTKSKKSGAFGAFFLVFLPAVWFIRKRYSV